MREACQVSNNSTSTLKAFPGFSHLYGLEEGAGHGFRVHLNLERDESTQRILRAESQPLKPLEGQWYMGATEAADVVWTGYGTLFVLFAQRVVQLMHEVGLTGWSAVPVKVADKFGESLPPYYLLQGVGRCGPPDESRSEKFHKEILPGRRVPMLRGLYFDEASWDGSDFFVPQGSALLLASERVKDAFAKAKVRGGLKFRPLNEWECDA
jgi:hypothetical protein